MSSGGMNRLWVCISMGLLLGGGLAASSRETEAKVGQHPQTFEREVRATVKMDYLLYVPESYHDSKEAWPLLLFLHGAGERGDDVNRVAIHGPPKRVVEGKEFPFILVSPQCPQRGWWTSEIQLAALNGLMDEMISRFRIDEDRMYLTGLSMGGFGSWALAAAYPGRFAAIVPICGGGEVEIAPDIAHIPAWVFHGAKDNVVSLDRSQKMVDALKGAGGDVTFTVYPEAGHDSWTETYNNPKLYPWLLQHSRADR